jgi:hypothetical protein
MSLTKRQRGLVITAVVIAGYAVGTWAALNQGYSFGRNVTLVSLVKNADLTEEERESAAEHHDIPIP